jgi:hypothetical protein
MKQENHNTNNINYMHILTIVFIVLKLCGVIGWNWIYVILPSIISITLTIIIIIITIIVLVVTNKK